MIIDYKEIAQATHVLIAGTTGSGKSNIINGFICNNILRKDCEFVLIDPKRVELSRYKELCNVKGYYCEMPEILKALDNVINCMQERFEQMEEKQITFYSGRDLYVIIDELADIMLQEPRKGLEKLQRIAQLARAAKIHLVCATQCPSRKVLPAALVLNLTYRIGLHCLSSIESKQIINKPGCENLPIVGKALILKPDGVQAVDVPLTEELFIYKSIELKKMLKNNPLTYNFTIHCINEIERKIKYND